MGRNPCCSKVGLKKGAWTSAEDKLLTDYINLYGEGNWRSLPIRAGLQRCGKSCRLRWLNYLRPDIKRGNIAEDEDDLIIRLHKLLGNRWSLIAGRLPGRTDNEIKNYWNTTLRKRVQNNSAALIAKQSDKKITGMDSRSIQEPDNKIHLPESRTSTKTRRVSKASTSHSQKQDETNKSLAKDRSDSSKIETGYTDRENLSSDINRHEKLSLFVASDTECLVCEKDIDDFFSGTADGKASQFVSPEQLHVSDYINPEMREFLDFSYGSKESNVLSSSLDDFLMISDEIMLENWAKSDYAVQPEMNSHGLEESPSRVWSDLRRCF